MKYRKAVHWLFIWILLLTAGLQPITAQAQSNPNVAAPLIMLPSVRSLAGYSVEFNGGWNETSLKGRILVGSKNQPLSVISDVTGDVKAADANQTLELVATATAGGATIYVYLASATMLGGVGLGVGIIILIGIETLPDDYGLLSESSFLAVREDYYPNVYPGNPYLPEEIDRQVVGVNWGGPGPTLAYLDAQDLTLVDASFENLIPKQAVVANVLADGGLRYIVTYAWAANGWGSEHLSPSRDHSWLAGDE